MTPDDERLRELATQATPGPWCVESCGEKGDGSEIIGVAFHPDDKNCETPLNGVLCPLRPWQDYYRDEVIAECEHRNRNAAGDAAYIAACSPDRILDLLRRLDLWREYAELLGAELAEIVPFTVNHGWRRTPYKK